MGVGSHAAAMLSLHSQSTASSLALRRRDAGTGVLPLEWRLYVCFQLSRRVCELAACKTLATRPRDVTSLSLSVERIMSMVTSSRASTVVRTFRTSLPVERAHPFPRRDS